jgi:DNA invertase Pin-like site-specific DNA recombinase
MNSNPIDSSQGHDAGAPGAAAGSPPAPAGTPTPAAGDGHPPAPAKKNQKRVALYLRVSTSDQHAANQERDLRAMAERAGWEIVAVYKDEGISGSKGRDRRPQFDALCKAATRREFDMVASWAVDRLSRSVQDLSTFMNDMRSLEIDVFLMKQGVDTSTPSGRLVANVFASIGEWEREMIIDRVKSGMARAKAQGKRLGKPAVSAAKEDAVRAELARGTGLVKAARLHGVGTYTAQRIKREMDGVQQ